MVGRRLCCKMVSKQQHFGTVTAVFGMDFAGVCACVLLDVCLWHATDVCA